MIKYVFQLLAAF